MVKPCALKSSIRDNNNSGIGGQGLSKGLKEIMIVSMDYFVFQKEQPYSITEWNARHTEGWHEGHDAPRTDSHSSLRLLHIKITAVSALK
ncbi:Uncharacterised protein [Escherichia coli]|nr:Uncharacterised protein [Escherichia coli]